MSYNEKYREVDIIQKAVLALQECLQQIADGDVKCAFPPRSLSGSRPDIVASFDRGHPMTMIVEVKRSGEPKFAREAFYQLESYLREAPEALPVFIAPYIAPHTARLCRDERIGYMDLAGNCHFSFPGVYIHVEGQINPFGRSPALKTLYQPKAERVLRVLLHNHPRDWRIQKLADEANVSIGQAHKVKELLLEHEWVVDSPQGVALSKPEELLKEWANRYRSDKHLQTLRHTLTNLGSFETQFSSVCRQLNLCCAVTSLAAASRYAPHASYLRSTAYVVGDLATLDRMLELTPVASGANVVLLTPYDDGVFYGVRYQDGVYIASPVQTYLDLQRAGGRAAEAAELLLEREISTRW